MENTFVGPFKSSNSARRENGIHEMARISQLVSSSPLASLVRIRIRRHYVATKLAVERKRRRSDLVVMWHSICGVTSIIMMELWMSLTRFWALIQLWFSSSERFQVQTWLEKYLPYVPEDFAESWRDGRLLAILLNKLHPGCFPDAFHLDPDYGLKNVYRVFDALEMFFGIKPNVSVEEIVICSDGSDAKLFSILLELKNLSDSQPEIIKEPEGESASDVECAAVSQGCIAKGTGLAVGFVERITNFTIFCAVMSDLDVVVEIRGPNSICSERITKRSPRQKCSISFWKNSKQMTRSISVNDNDISTVSEEDESFEPRIIPLEYQIIGKQINIDYKPRQKGIHKISILWHGKHVSDSPYTVAIEEPSEVIGVKHVIPLKSALKTEKDGEKHDPRKISFLFPESHSKCKKQESNPKSAAKVVRRKVLRYIVKVHGKDIPVNADSTQALATELLKLDYNSEICRSFHRRNSWGFTGDAERKKSVIRQFCVDVKEMEAQISQRRSRSLSVTPESSKLLDRSDSFDSLTSKLHSLSEDALECGEKTCENEEDYAYINEDINTTDEANEIKCDDTPQTLHLSGTEDVEGVSLSPELAERKFDIRLKESLHWDTDHDISSISTDIDQVDRSEDDPKSSNSTRTPPLGHNQDKTWENEGEYEDLNTKDESNEKVSDDTREVLHLANTREGIKDASVLSDFTKCKFDISFKESSHYETDHYTISSLSTDVDQVDRSEDDSLSSNATCTFSVEQNQGKTCENEEDSTYTSEDLNTTEDASEKKPANARKMLYHASTKEGTGEISPSSEFTECKFDTSLKESSHWETDCDISSLSTDTHQVDIFEDEHQSSNTTCAQSGNSACAFSLEHKPNKSEEIGKMPSNSRFLNGKLRAAKFLQNREINKPKTSIKSDVENKINDFKINSKDFPDTDKQISQKQESKIRNDVQEHSVKSFSDSARQTKKSEIYHNFRSTTQNGETIHENNSKNVDQDACAVRFAIKPNSNHATQSFSKPEKKVENHLMSNDNRNLKPREQLVLNGSFRESFSSTTNIETKTKYASLSKPKPFQTHTLKVLEQVNFRQFNPPMASENSISPVKVQIGQWERTFSEQQNASPQKLYTTESEPVNVREKLAFWEQKVEFGSSPKPARKNIQLLGNKSTLDCVKDDDLQKQRCSGNISNIPQPAVKEKNETYVNEEKYVFTKLEIENKILPELQVEPYKIRRRNFSDPVVPNSSAVVVENQETCTDHSSLESSAEESFQTSDENVDEFESDESDDSGCDYLLASTEDEYIDDEIASEYWGDLSIVKGWKETKDPVHNSFLDQDFLPNYQQFDKSYPEECKVFGIAVYYGYVAIKNRFQVYTGDAGFGNLSVSMQGFRQHEVSLVSVAYARNEIYEVTYQVMTAGYYLISIRWMDKEIHGSPFVCKVTF